MAIEVVQNGVVHIEGRIFPGIVIQGDTLNNLFEGTRLLLAEFKRTREEDQYYEALMLAESIQEYLAHYESILIQNGFGLPYAISIQKRLVSDNFDVE